MAKYIVIDRPTNGTTGQDVGRFELTELPERLQAAVNAAPDAGEWVLPALADGDRGAELADLQTVVRAVKTVGPLTQAACAASSDTSTRTYHEGSNALVMLTSGKESPTSNHNAKPETSP